MAEQIIPKCPACGTELKKVEGKSHFGCPNWKPPGQNGCEGTIYWPEGYRKNNYPNKAFSYRGESKSNPGNFHSVIIYESGDIDCPCYAGSANKFCRHKKEMLDEIGKLLDKIKKKNNL